MTSPGGRFRAPLDPGAQAYSSSIGIDRELAAEDIAGSIAHAAMLAESGVISRSDARAIARGLREIQRELEAGTFDPTSPTRARLAGDDIHMAIERRLIQKIGPRGGALHTARSRNDQVALDERLFLAKAIEQTRVQLVKLERALLRQASRHRTVMMPGYTHLQRGQPILLAHHLLAHISMLDRDGERLADCAKRVRRSPLGAAALAGTSFPINRRDVARKLGLETIVENSIDAVSDRDVQIEFISAAAITMMHLSRLAEELVLWSSEEWRFVEIGEAFTTGSSIMPQKRNPDIAELLRGKTGRVYGHLVALLTVMKGLPLAYNRDMQEDKEPLIDTVATLKGSLEVAAGMISTLRFDPARFEEELEGSPALATELADYLVRKGVPFREAHGAAGSAVRMASERGVSLRDLSLAAFRRCSPHFSEDLYRCLSARGSLAAKRSEGSTRPAAVARAIARWERRLRP